MQTRSHTHSHTLTHTHVYRNTYSCLHTQRDTLMHDLIDTSGELASDLNACDPSADNEDVFCVPRCCSPLCKFLQPIVSEQPIIILYVYAFVRGSCGNYNSVGLIFLAFAVARGHTSIFHNAVRYGRDFLDIYQAGAVNSLAVAKEECAVVREQDLMFTSLCSVIII